MPAVAAALQLPFLSGHLQMLARQQGRRDLYPCCTAPNTCSGCIRVAQHTSRGGVFVLHPDTVGSIPRSSIRLNGVRMHPDGRQDPSSRRGARPLHLENHAQEFRPQLLLRMPSSRNTEVVRNLAHLGHRARRKGSFPGGALALWQKLSHNRITAVCQGVPNRRKSSFQSAPCWL